MAAAQSYPPIPDEPKSETRIKRQWKAKGDEYFRQGNWKRRSGVATRHEIVVAIDTLIATGHLAITNGELQATRGGDRPEAVTREERWARQDEELRAFCQRVEVHESKSMRPRDEYDVQSQASMLEATLFRSEPRRHVGAYVLRELRHPMGARGYQAVIDAIFVEGGWEWVLEEPRKVVKAGRKR